MSRAPRALLVLCLWGLTTGCAHRPAAPASGGYTVARVQGGQAVRPGLSAEVLLSPQPGGQGASLVLLGLEAGQSVAPHRHAGSEILFLLEGDGELSSSDAIALHAQEGVWLPPGAVHGFRAAARTRVLALYTPAGPERRYQGGSDPGTEAVEDLAQARVAPLPVKFSPGTATPLRIGGGTGVARLGLEDAQSPRPPASCALLELGPGGAVPDHSHPDSEELLFVFEGAAVMTVDGREERLTAPVAVRIAPGVKHEVTVTSATPLRAVQWYTPPGPEQRFKPR